MCGRLHGASRRSEVTQLCPTLCNSMDYSPPGSSVHGILQARILEWVVMLPPGNLPDPGIKSRSPALQTDSLLSEPPGKGARNELNWSPLVRRRGCCQLHWACSQSTGSQTMAFWPHPQGWRREMKGPTEGALLGSASPVSLPHGPRASPTALVMSLGSLKSHSTVTSLQS